MVQYKPGKLTQTVHAGNCTSSQQSATHDGRADMTNFEMDLFDTRMTRISRDLREDSESCCSVSRRHKIIGPACLPITVVALLVIALVFVPLLNDDDLELSDKFLLQNTCSDSCDVGLTETIPAGLTYERDLGHPQTYQTWLDIINRTEKYLDIAQMYWQLTDSNYSTAVFGKQVFRELIAAAKRGVKIRIAQSPPTPQFPQADTQYLQDNNLARVRSVNLTRLQGRGILHTKFIISDMRHVYIGSANGDWKSLAEVKELGIFTRNCPCIATDLYRVFAVYWKLGEDDSYIPHSWPISYRTQFNAEKPMNVSFNNNRMAVYISSSPPKLNPKNREHDLNAITKTIDSAKSSVCISVMDYLPQSLYRGGENVFWPAIDDVIRSASFRGVRVRMLLSHWNHTRPEMDAYLQSLLALNRAFKRGQVEVKVFVVPASREQARNPFTRVNHAKFMVTEDTAYIGTSNWSADYFTDTAGVALVARSTRSASLVTELQAVFDRDWSSPYASSL